MDKFVKLKIVPKGQYPVLSDAQVFLNEMDITSSIAHLYLEAGPEEITKVILELNADVDISDLPVYAVMDNEPKYNSIDRMVEDAKKAIAEDVKKEIAKEISRAIKP